MFKNLSITQLRPAEDNVRRKVGDVSDIVASIPTYGIVQPLVVAPKDDDTYIIIAGHRRFAAAEQAGLETVPCIVRHVSDEERIELALIENLQREDISVTDEAAGYFRLVEAGWKVKDLAKRVGRSTRHVSGRLSLLELPKRIQAKVDRGDLTIADAAELLRAKGHPEVFAELVSAVLEDRIGNVAWSVSRALDDAERADKRTQAVAKAEAKGLTVIDHDGWGIPTRAGRAIGNGCDDLDVDKRAHTKEPCHAVLVDRDGATRALCTDPSRHAKKGPSEVKSATPLRSTPSPAQADQRAHQKAMRESAQARQAQLRGILGRRLPKGDVVRLALMQFIESTNQVPAKLACNLLGLEAPDAADDYYGARAVSILGTEAAESDATLIRVALAIAFGLAEERMTSSYGAWTSPQVAAHFAFLDTAGYERSEFEEAELVRAADVAEEHAQRRREWAEDRQAGKKADIDDPNGEPGELEEEAAAGS
jgi:ParB/RepB/Spo0J family partition protein